MKTKTDDIPMESEVLYEHFRSLSHTEIDCNSENQVFDHPLTYLRSIKAVKYYDICDYINLSLPVHYSILLMLILM
jgi:hypothetical protein